MESADIYCKDCPYRNGKSPEDTLNENWKMKNLRLTKENKALRKQNNELRRNIQKINDLSSGKHI